jgi:hypothetical protein
VAPDLLSEVYLACHTRQRKAASSETYISARHSSRLAHVDEARGMTPTTLARYLGEGRAMRNSSVLEPERVKPLLAAMKPDNRRAASGGLALLAEAAERMNTSKRAARA